VLTTELDHRREVPGVVPPEPHVVADDDAAGAQRSREIARDELAGGLRGEVERVGHHQDGVEAGRGHELQAVRETGEELRRGPGPVHGGRVRVERHRDGGAAVGPGETHEAAQHRLVAAVDAVEVADRHHGRAVAVGDLVDVREHLHRFVLLRSGYATSGADRPG
jgi:hypothetical protein